MELTYTWKITRLKKQDNPSIELNDIIVQTYWECTGTNADGISGTFSGATPFSPDQIDPENFTSYEDLTEEQVIEWVQGAVVRTPGYQAHIDEKIIKQIEAQMVPVVEVGPGSLPWAPEPPVIPEPTPEPEILSEPQ